MTLNEFVYDPKGKSNSTLFSLTKGTFTFVAGKVAKTGDMKIDTPVATMGIRETDRSRTQSLLLRPAATRRSLIPRLVIPGTDAKQIKQIGLTLAPRNGAQRAIRPPGHQIPFAGTA
jgi:hypothetical protein